MRWSQPWEKPEKESSRQRLHKFKDSEAKMSLGQFTNSKEWEEMRSGSWQGPNPEGVQ